MPPLGLRGVEEVGGRAGGMGLGAGWPWALAVCQGLGAGVALVWLLPTHVMLEKGRAGLCWAFPVLRGLKVCWLLSPGKGQHIVGQVP